MNKNPLLEERWKAVYALKIVVCQDWQHTVCIGVLCRGGIFCVVCAQVATNCRAPFEYAEGSGNCVFVISVADARFLCRGLRVLTSCEPVHVAACWLPHGLAS